MSAVHTCITCRVAFQDLEAQRHHYKTDWHRYNLKRKVAELPAVTADEFNSKVCEQRARLEQDTKDRSRYCQPCCKNFSTENSHANHLNSRRHQENSLRAGATSSDTALERSDADPPAARFDGARGGVGNDGDHDDEDDDVEEVDSDEWEEDTEVDVRRCLFCEHRSRSLVRNMRHMTSRHSFFVPDADYCTDLEGLVAYLCEKVQAGFLCLWCNERGRAFRGADAAQRHMRDKGHCKLLHEGPALAEYVPFYDYSASYPDAATVVAVDDGEEEEAQPPELLDGDGYELVLPSGARVGHRSLLRYYRQSLPPSGAAAATAVAPTARRLHRVLAHYRSLGWTATQRETAARKARDIQCMRRAQARWATALSLKANRLQHHFRAQVNF